MAEATKKECNIKKALVTTWNGAKNAPLGTKIGAGIVAGLFGLAGGLIGRATAKKGKK